MFKIISIGLVTIIGCVTAHGTMQDPVARQSRWRYNSSAPVDNDDVGLNCGGSNVQWNINKGKCGVCGDNYLDSTPRSHELGGRFGEGVIVRTYNSGTELPVSVQLTANHRGYFEFQLCNLDNSGETEACFAQTQLRLTNGSDRYVLPTAKPDWFAVSLQIPSGYRCNHCVLQWTYVAGNTWGWCADGTGAEGCGPQEHFRGCSDISIK